MKASGIRLGTAAITSRGLGRAEIARLAAVIADVLHAPADTGVAQRARGVVRELTEAFPIRGRGERVEAACPRTG
jgi:glycine hydroxymethyltransferase